MRHAVCTVFDSASRLFGQLQVVPNTSVAVRSFTDGVNNPQSGPLHGHPEDFSLVKVGEYDDELGELFPLRAETLIRGQDCKK